MSTYNSHTRAWAVETYRKSRHNHTSRAECAAAIAAAIGAHENTVARWIKIEFGPAREPSADEARAKLHAIRAEVERLRSENRTLAEQVAELRPRNPQNPVM